jgi:hypothetical protein
MKRTSVWLMIEDELILFGEGGVVKAARADGYNPNTQKPWSYTQLFNWRNDVIGRVNTKPSEIFALLREFYSSEAAE